MSIIFCIPISDTKAISLPLADPADDVVLLCSTKVITNIYQPTVDIAELDVNISGSYISFSFYGTPVIDTIHRYNVTVFWDASGTNRTDCLVGIKDYVLYYGSYTVLRNSTGIVYSYDSNDTAYVDGNTIFFPIIIPPLTLERSIETVSDAGGIATVPAEETDGTTVTPSTSSWYVDACGMFPAWIPIPDEGSIELPIIMTLLGSSFIIILVIRRRKKRIT